MAAYVCSKSATSFFSVIGDLRGLLGYEPKLLHQRQLPAEASFGADNVIRMDPMGSCIFLP